MLRDFSDRIPDPDPVNWRSVVLGLGMIAVVGVWWWTG